ncbi:MAG TPA: autotransporter-associated beta strand repeat-containing protein [Opitutaceae bacterium]|nr:autotransporter-associated beta strand repeat-containing protein [Opitutaceae bacterium]
MLVLGLAAAVSLHAQTTITETFASTTTPANWSFTNSTTSYTPQSGQAIGNGTYGLRLSNNSGNVATAAQYLGTFNSAGASVYAQFNYQMYGGTAGTTIGGDGFTFFLYDGSNVSSFNVGAYGGSMGYAQKTGISGLSGGYIGVGLDAYGNYSIASEGRVGGMAGATTPDQTTESIAVRGPASGGYAYLGGTSAHLGTGVATTNVDSTTVTSTTNTVQVLLSATNQLTVTLAQGGSTPQTVLQMDLSGYARPDTLSFGFTAGSGGATDNIYVNNLTVTTLTASRWTNAGGTGNWGLNTNWNPSIVPNTGSDILFDNSGVTSAQIINTAANRSIRAITFDAPFDYTVNNNTLTLANGGIAGFSGIAVTQTHGTATDTINSALSLGNAISVRNNATGTLNLNGNIATNGNTLTFDGTGNGTNVGGVISGTGAVVKNDVGTATLTAANTYTGGTTINNGTLNANHSAALGTAAVNLAGGTLGSTNGSSVTNTLSLTADSGLSGTTTSGTLTQVGANHTLNMTNAVQSGAVRLSDTNIAHTLTVNVDSGTSTISGAISNGGTAAGGVTKTGSGTLVVSGANSYTGTTTISNGILQLGASDRLSQTGSVSIDSAGTLDLNGFSQKVGTLTALNGGATIDFGTPGNANNFVFGTYVAPSSGVLVVNNWESGVDKLATTGRSQSVSTIYISGYGAATEAGATSAVGTYGNAYLLTPSAQQLNVWDGSSSGLWNNRFNWSLNAVPTTTQVAVFDSTGANRTAVSLNANYTVAGVQFGTTAPSYTISGTSTLTLSGAVPYIQQKSDSDQTFNANLALSANSVMDVTGSGNLVLGGTISGTRNLIKDGLGDGKLILTGNNTLSGGVFINNGIVQALKNGNNTVLGTGTTTVSAGATLELAGGISLANAMSVVGGGLNGAGAIHAVTGSNSLSGTITETADATLSADTGAALILGGPLTGTNTDTYVTGPGAVTLGAITTGNGNLILNSTGTVTLNGAANTFTGLTTVNSGTLVLAKAAGTTAVAGNLLINGGAVQLNASNQIANTSTVSLAGSGSLNLNGYSETLDQLNSSSSASSVLLGGGALTINAINNQNSNFAGSLGGTSASSFTIDGTGKVNLSGNNSGFAGTFNVTSGTLNVSATAALGSSTVAVSSGGNFQLQGGITASNSISIVGSGTSNNGAIENFAGNNALNGTITLTGASAIESDSGILTLGGTVGLGGNTLTVGGSGGTSISGTVTGTGGITKTDAGTLTLSGANTYSGGTTVSAGTVRASSNGSLGSAGATVASGATLQLGSGVTVANGITLNGTGTSNNGALESVGTSSYTGTLTLASASRVQSDAGMFTLGGTVALGTNALTIGGAANTTITGSVTGTGGITKVDAGSLTLAGTTGMTGRLTVNAGTATLAATNALASSATLTINNGGGLVVNSGLSQTIAGLTTTSGATITIGSNATLTVNSSSASSLLSSVGGAGTLAYTGGGNLTLGSGLNVAGTLSFGGTTIGGTPTTTLYLNGNVNIGTLRITGDTILDFGNSTATSLNASNLIITNGAKVTVVNWVNMTDYFVAQNFFQQTGTTLTSAPLDQRGTAPENQITFSGSTSSQTVWQSFDHEITPAPEPATYGVIFTGVTLGAVGLLRWSRRRRETA